MPQGRVCHTANLIDNKIYVFGGFTSRYGVRTALQDLWYLDVSKLYDKVVSWKAVVTSGLVNPRYFHQSLHLSSLDIGQHLLLTIGGGIDPKSSWAPSQYLNQMSLLHLGKNEFLGKDINFFYRGSYYCGAGKDRKWRSGRGSACTIVYTRCIATSTSYC